MKERHFSTRASLSNMIKSTEEISLGEQTDIKAMIENYKRYKKSFVRNMKYDPNSYDLGKYILPLNLNIQLWKCTILLTIFLLSYHH